jgi:hypothetical protein
MPGALVRVGTRAPVLGSPTASSRKQQRESAICQYDVREFDGPSLLEAIKAHPDVSDLGFAKFVT